jgi:hypothetical protein
MNLPHVLFVPVLVLLCACGQDQPAPPAKSPAPAARAPETQPAQRAPAARDEGPAPAEVPAAPEGAGDPPAPVAPQPAPRPDAAQPDPAAAAPAPVPAPAPAPQEQAQPAGKAPAPPAPARQDEKPKAAPAPATGGADGAPPAPKPETPPADEDAKARAILAKAAALQSAGDLAEPGKLESFHVVFHKATFERQTTRADGTSTAETVEADTDGLVMRWKKGSLRTDITLDGHTTAKAWYEPMKIGWIYDGKRVASLLGDDRKNDYDELQFHRRVIDQLLDVAILDKLLRDGSKWKVLPDAAPYTNAVAIRRTPPDGAQKAAPLTLWIDHPSADVWGDVVAAATPPSSDGGATIRYEFKYHDTFPKVRRKTGEADPEPTKMRFPFQVVVHEQRADEAKARKVLEVFTNSVDINTVTDGDFAQPKK